MNKLKQFLAREGDLVEDRGRGSCSGFLALELPHLCFVCYFTTESNMFSDFKTVYCDSLMIQLSSYGQHFVEPTRLNVGAPEF